MSAPKNLCPGCMSDQSGLHPCPSCGWDGNTILDNSLYLPAGYLLNNRYAIGKVIGVGGFGVVYIAWDTNLDVRAAIKEFLPREYAARSSNHISITPYTGSANEEFSIGVEKFLEEAKALARFQDHSGIVTVHESFRTNNTAYMVMQYLDGMTMKEYLKRQPGEKIAFNMAVKAMTPIMDALREVHNAGFVHRDISPDNIFLTSQNQVKLLDFGSARYAIGEHSKSLTSVLKHGYAPVEQYSVKGKQGPWSDVYAVCATLYRCVTGFVPPDAMERIQGDTIKSPKQLGIDIPERGELAIMRGLALKAYDRFESIQQLQQALTTGEMPAKQMGHGERGQPHRLEEQNIIVCSKCGTKNQLNHGDDPNGLRYGKWRCGKCKSELSLNPVAGTSVQERNDTVSKPEIEKKKDIKKFWPLLPLFLIVFILIIILIKGTEKKEYEELYNKAEALCSPDKCNDPQKTIEYLNEAIRLKPDYSEAYHVRGRAYLHLEQYHLTINNCNEAIRLKPDDFRPYINRGIAYEYLEQYQEAMKDFSEGIRLKPDNFLAYLNRGNLYANLKQYQLAINDADEAIRLKSDNFGPYFLKGRVYFILGNYNEAINNFNEVIHLKPDNFQSYLNRGVIYSSKKQYQQAIEDFNEAIRLKSDNFVPYFLRGIVYDQLGNYNQAIADYDKAIEINPEYAEAYNDRGISYHHLGNKMQAFNNYKIAARLGLEPAQDYLRKLGIAW